MALYPHRETLKWIATAIAAWAGVIIACISLIVSCDNSHKISRAYINFQGTQVIVDHPDSQTFHYYVNFRNFGQTAAYMNWGYFNSKFGSSIDGVEAIVAVDLETSRRRYRIENKGGNQIFHIIPANSSYQPYVDAAIKDGEIQNYLNNNNFRVDYGHLFYKDIYGVGHESSFCEIHNIVLDKEKTAKTCKLNLTNN